MWAQGLSKEGQRLNPIGYAMVQHIFTPAIIVIPAESFQ
jgi:hypothetical protein